MRLALSMTPQAQGKTLKTLRSEVIQIIFLPAPCSAERTVEKKQRVLEFHFLGMLVDQFQFHGILIKLVRMDIFSNKLSKTEETLTGSPKAYQIFRDSQENV